jgi:predicted nuclease of predicted toxin-antitoxin system
MKFKLNENLPRELAEDLLRLGHDVDSVHGEGLVGAQDAAVLEAGRAAGRILMTLDKGVASLVRFPLHRHSGVVLIRPDESGRRTVLDFIRSRLADSP